MRRFCSGAGIVPIVEPEVADGGAHSVERPVTSGRNAPLNSLFTELMSNGVALESDHPQTQYVVAANKCANSSTREQIANAQRLKCHKDTVFRRRAAIALLSGGQENEDHPQSRHDMNKIGGFPVDS